MDKNLSNFKRASILDPSNILCLQLLKRRLGYLPISILYTKVIESGRTYSEFTNFYLFSTTISANGCNYYSRTWSCLDRSNYTRSFTQINTECYQTETRTKNINVAGTTSRIEHFEI